MKIKLLATAACATAMALIGAPSAQAQKTLRIAMTAADIPTTTGMPNNGFEGMRFVGYTAFDALVLWDLSQTERLPDIKPGLATAWKVDEADKTKWVFTLRQGVKFHDGAPFNADAVAWNLARFYDDKSPQFEPNGSAITRARVPLISKWEKVDDYTIPIYTKVPLSYFPFMTAQILLASPAAWEKAGKNWADVAKAPAGTGPFKITKVNPRQSILMEKNADYWDKARVPKVDRLMLVPMPEATTRLSALRSNQVDWIEVPPPDAIPSLKSAGYVVSTSRYPHIWPWVLKITHDSPFADKRVRQAANFAVDRDALVKLLNGTAEPATGFWPKDTVFAGSPSLKYSYDPAKAKALLAEAGYGPDKPVKVRIQISTSGSGQMLPIPMNEVIQRSMKAAGFEVEFDVVEWGQMLVTFRQGPDNATVQKLHGSNISLVTWDHSMAFRWFHSRNVAPTSSNWGQFKSPNVDALLNEIEVDFSGKDIAPKLAKLNELLVDEAPWLFIVHDLNPRAFSKKVEGYTPAQSWFTDLTRVSLK